MLPGPPQSVTGPIRRVRSAAAALVIGLVAAACGGSSPETADDAGPGSEKTQLRVAYVPATTTLLAHVAEVQGYFDENGLDVVLTEAANISDIPAALGRQFDVALGTATDLLRAGSAGVDVVQVSGNTIDTAENPFVQLIVGPDSGITDVTQLEGRRVGSPTLSGVIHVAVLHWLKEEGVDPSAVTGVQVPPPNLPDQLNAGQIDAAEALEPFASQLQASGNVSLGDPFASIGLPLATNFWMASGEWARSNGDAVTAFVESLEQAKGFVETNEAEARRILQGYTGLPPQVGETVPLPTYDLDIRVEDLATWAEVLRGLGELDGDVDPQELVVSDG